MSAELIAILAVGIALFGVQMTTFIYLIQRMDKIEARMTALEVGQKSLELELKQSMSKLETELKKDMSDLRVEMVERMSTLEVSVNGRMSTLEVSLTERVARLEGVVLARTESDNGTVGVSGDD